MASTTGKRKREVPVVRSLSVKKPALGSRKSSSKSEIQHAPVDASKVTAPNGASNRRAPTSEAVCIQIIAGSYERVLHGISARIPLKVLDSEQTGVVADDTSKSSPHHEVTFSDTFLFAAHASAIRCLAISPPTDEADKRYLATGSSDERINVYSLSTAPLSSKLSNTSKVSPPLLAGIGTAVAENRRNRSLGSLVHHERAITRLQFPTRTKLFSAAEDATIAISRTRDWTVLSSIKAPIPKPQGRPSGDTAGPGEVPAGVNDFSIHPSQKLMLSVGRGEKCMRLWNLMTGKKAAVLSFDRDLLAAVESGGTGRSISGSGEGQRVLFDPSGEGYVVGFEKGAVLFDLDAKPQGIFKSTPPSKIHQMRYIELDQGANSILAFSTEDGRIVFFDASEKTEGHIAPYRCIAQLGGRPAGIEGRFKDFEVLRVAEKLVFVTGSSDGAIRVWSVQAQELRCDGIAERQIGQLVATQDTGNRITCLGAFVLDGKVRNDQDEMTSTEGGLSKEQEEDEDEEDSGESSNA